MKPLVIIGGGGHGRVVLDCALVSGVQVAGFLDTNIPVGELINNIPVLGNNSKLQDADFVAQHRFIVALGDQEARRELSLQIVQQAGELATIIHPSAIISKRVSIGQGTAIIAGAVINTDAKIGDYCIINTGATIDHDVVLEDGVQICPGVNLAGSVHCEADVFIGTGAALIPTIRIGKNSRIGAGAVVLEDVPANMLMVGNPARKA